MDHFIFNGKLIKAGMPVISVANRGLRYGDGLFETIKSKNGQLFFADEHFARLWKGMQILQFQIPKHFTPEKLDEEIQVLTKKNGHNNLARIRINVFRADGGLYDAISHIPFYTIESWPLPEEKNRWNDNGLVLGIYDSVKKSTDILSNLKHNNFLPYLMAALHAKKQKWNDAILLNTYGRLCDTSIANIFLIKDEVLYTPSLVEGCVAGIMRHQLTRQLKKMNYTVIEKEITTDELFNADEVFLTNSIFDIRWVKEIDGKNYTNNLTRQIYTAFLPTIS